MIYNDQKYLYWESKISAVMDIRSTAISTTMLGLMDNRALVLLLIVRDLYDSFGVYKNLSDYSAVITSYNDLLALAYILNNYFIYIGSSNKCEIVNSENNTELEIRII